MEERKICPFDGKCSRIRDIKMLCDEIHKKLETIDLLLEQVEGNVAPSPIVNNKKINEVNENV